MVTELHSDDALNDYFIVAHTLYALMLSITAHRLLVESVFVLLSDVV